MGLRFSFLAAILGLLVVCGSARTMMAQTPNPDGAPRRTITAYRVPDGQRIVVDGRLDEEAWKQATPGPEFTQQDPTNGAPPSERTEIRFVYTKTALYMGVICYDDEPDRLIGFQRRRDEFLPADDRFMWVIDPFLTGQNGYFFETNPSGLMGDALISPTGQNRQWDGIWTLRIEQSKIGWTIEVEIPFSTLSFDPNGHAWGINFQRTVRRKQEELMWNGWARNQGLQRLTNTGLLEGLNDVNQGRGIELRPYALTTSEASPGTGQRATKNAGKAGLDFVYSPTPGLRANLTVNTDFAQTEVDQRVVNLTQFPLFLPEKRTFFLEGANLFDFGSVFGVSGFGGGFNKPDDNSLIPFFTRRVGLDDAGNPQRIDYGVKLFGQIGRQDVGVLQVRSVDDVDRGADTSNVFVARVKRRMLRQSYVGGLYTRLDERGTIGARETIGGDFRFGTPTFMGSKNISLGGFVLGSRGAATSGRSASYGFRLDYPNDRWNGGLIYKAIQENFDPALGFQLRNDYEEVNPYFNFSPRPKDHPYIRRMGFTADVDAKRGMKSIYESVVWNFTLLNVDFHAGDTFSVLVVPEHERLDRPFNLPRLSLPAGGSYDFVRYRITANSAARRKIAVTPTVEWGGFFGGTRTRIASDITLRARPGVIVYTSGEWNRIDLPQGRVETKLFRATPEFQFSQWLALVNTLQYDSVSRGLGWQARFRWILRPGNDLYVVYTHNWVDDPLTNQFTTVNRKAASKFVYTQRF